MFGACRCLSGARVRLLVGAALAASVSGTLVAQIPGRNVNMVAGNTWPTGDPFLQRQNEPSVAASTRNPLHLLGGANDYRTVDLPGLPTGDETGDAWLGLFKSFDGGQRWISTLLPGYPQDASQLQLPPDQRSPVYGYQAAADPVVRAGTNGLVYFAGLAFDRGESGKSAIFVSRFIDNNNKEAGDPFAYLGTRVVAKDPGTTGVFLDKPWMAVDIPRTTRTCTIQTPGEDGPIVQTLPAGTIYVAYSSITEDNIGQKSQIFFSRSIDCGITWSNPERISRPADRINQGATIAINPQTGAVAVVWRKFDLEGDQDSIMVAVSRDLGAKFGLARVAQRFPRLQRIVERIAEHRRLRTAKQAAEIASFDQGTSAAALAFRTNAYPTAVYDAQGRLYVAWTQRGFATSNPDPADGHARILVTTSTDGARWSPPAPIADEATDQEGHQIMPSLAFAGGQLMVAYYDLREDRSSTFTKFVDDATAIANAGRRHTMDLRASLGLPGAVPQFAPSVRVSDYLLGYRPSTGQIDRLQVNPPNLPMFRLGTVPFMGDYIDLAPAPVFVPTTNGRWRFNTDATGTPPVFHAVWADNRDVRTPPRTQDPVTGQFKQDWTKYAPPTYLPGISPFDPSRLVPRCEPGYAGTRNQNIYTSRITGGLLVGSPGNSKQLSPELQRAFVVFAQNGTADTRVFRLTIQNQPAGGRASFEQFPLPPYGPQSPPPRTFVDVTIPPRSTASRTVYVTSSDARARVEIDVVEIVAVGNPTEPADALSGRVSLNPDILNPEIDNPEIDNPEIDNPDIDNAEVYNPEIDNPEIDNPEIDNPEIDNPEIDNPEIDNVEVSNPEIDNPEIDNPEIDNPEIDNPEIDNPEIDNSQIADGVMTDVTWTVTNDGNTTAAFNVNLFLAQQTTPANVATQLILHKTYKTPVEQNCELKFLTTNILIANIPSPDYVLAGEQVADPNSSDATNATIWLAPGETAKITLRIWDPDKTDNVTVLDSRGNQVSIDARFVPSEDVTPVIQQQAVNTEDARDGVTEPPLVPVFPAPEAANDSATTTPNTPVRLNVLANDSAAFGQTKIHSFHPAGMASHAGGGSSDLTYVPATGLLYSLTSRGVGAVDPATQKLVGRLPVTNTRAPQFSAVSRDGVLYARYGNNGGPAEDPNGGILGAIDVRAGAPTFHQALEEIGSDLSHHVFTFVIDQADEVLYVAHGFNQPTGAMSTVTAIDINRESETFHQTRWSVAFPAGARVQSLAFDGRARRLYAAATGFASDTAGLYTVDLNAEEPVATRVHPAAAFSVVVDDLQNLVFTVQVIDAPEVPGRVELRAFDGSTFALLRSVEVATPVRFNATDERMGIDRRRHKVVYRAEQTVLVFDARRGESVGNLLANIDVGRAGTEADIVVDEDAGVAAAASEFGMRTVFVSTDTNAVVAQFSAFGAVGSLALDPVNHRVFAAVQRGSIQTFSLTPPALAGETTVYISGGAALVNPVTHRAYVNFTTAGANMAVMSGAGFERLVDPASNRPGWFTFGARDEETNRYIISNTTSNVTGSATIPGSLAVVDGATDQIVQVVETINSPFGIAVDPARRRAYVAGQQVMHPRPNTRAIPGQIGVHDLDNLAAFTPADTSAIVPLSGGANTASIGFGRYVVVNPETGLVYALVQSGSETSLAVLDPATNALTPLDGPDTPLGTARGRALVVRVHPELNRVYAAMRTPAGVTTTVALDATTHQFIAQHVGGSHSNVHTPSYLAVNTASDRVYVVDFNDDSVAMLDAETLAPLGTTPLPDGPSATAVSRTADRLYVSSVNAKALTALDGSTLEVTSSVHLPIDGFFLEVDEAEGRVYLASGDSDDEAGAMVVTDVLGQLGHDVVVTSVGSAEHGTVSLAQDNSVTYTPAPGFTGLDSFEYHLASPAGTATGAVSITVMDVVDTPVALTDLYSTTAGATLNVPAPGLLGNDLVGGSAVVEAVTTHPGLTVSPDGAFEYAALTAGEFQFTYRVVSGGRTSNEATVTITIDPGSTAVTNTQDSGPGSLRQAILTANASRAADVITFAIDGEVKTITPASALPAITSPVTIDGRSQPGFTGVPLIEIDGAEAGATPVLQLLKGADGSEIRSLVIGGGGSDGIAIVSASNVRLYGNYIGTATDGAAENPNGASGVRISGGGTHIIGGTGANEGNLISGNNQAGIQIVSSNGNVIVNNRIGTNAGGLGGLGNHLSGVEVLGGSNNVIGGTSGNEGNVISGNFAHGVRLVAPTEGAVTSLNTIAGNIIGLNAHVNAPLPNQTGYGIEITSAGGGTAHGNSIGCEDCASRNVIGGNFSSGIMIFGPGASGTRITNNRIGTNAAGDAAFGNLGNGIEINAAPGTIIGTAGAGNVISGNALHGIAVADGDGTVIAHNRVGVNVPGTSAVPNGRSGIDLQNVTEDAVVEQNVVSGNAHFGIALASGATGTRVRLNRIGTNAAGTAAIGNGMAGIVIDSAHDNIVGGQTAYESNIISGNSGAGVLVHGEATLNNRIEVNAIFDNGQLGIDLGATGVTANDPYDADSGPNALQNYPVLAFAHRLAETTRVAGTLHSSQGQAFTIRFFSSASCDPAGYGEGREFLGATVVNTNADGVAEFDIHVAYTAGKVVSATATGPFGTSEFAECAPISAPEYRLDGR